MKASKLIPLIADNPSFELDLDNIATDFTFTRASSATYVDVNGVIQTALTNIPRIDYSDATFDVPVYADLITNGDFATDTIWTYDPSYTISGGVAIYDGVSSGINIKQADADLSEPLKANTDYTLQFTISNSVAEARLFILDHSGSKVFVATTNYADGTHVINFTTPADIGSGGISFYTYNVSGGGAFDIDDISLTGVTSYTTTDDPAFLLEPASTNLITYSEDFSDAKWVSQQCTKSTETDTTPDGVSQTVDSIIANVGDAKHLIYWNNLSVTTNVNRVFSVFVKSTHRYITLNMQDGVAENFASAVFDLDNIGSGATETDVGTGSGTIVETKALSFGNDWYKLTLVAKTTGTALYPNIGFASSATGNSFNTSGQVSYDASGTEEIFLWGAELKEDGYPTSYIPTSGATATRSAELCVNGGSASVINSEEGTLIVEIAGLVDNNDDRLFGLTDGTNTNRIYIGYQDINKLYSSLYNGSDVVVFNSSGDVQTNFNKLAFKWETDNVSMWLNGVKIGEDLSTNTYSADTLDRIHFAQYNGVSTPFYGKVKSLAIYKEALSDSDLESKTT